MTQCQQLNKRDEDIVFKAIQKNSFLAHSEHVFIAAVCDNYFDVCRQAVEIINSSRQRVQPNGVCIFDKNDFNTAS